MAALHSALQALGPCKFDQVPKSPSELEVYLQDLFQQAQLILDSIPIPAPDEKLETRARSQTTTSIASNASEISSSSARSAPPDPEHAALQKEWGKPVKLATKDNPLNMAVYRLAGKDGRGAWFARRSVQEGLGFAKFKKSLEMEFPESLAVQGAPGEGNVRGIGGDKRVEDISVPGKGRVEVFQLSAQFPGPTAPRDFVTLLITSSNAIKQNDGKDSLGLSPRHYMIISKPCDHPETQARNGFVRGYYESIEFIREVPRLPKKTMSSFDLARLGAGKKAALEKEAVLRNAERKKTNTLAMSHENKSMNDLSAATLTSEEVRRRRGKTISFSESKAGDLRGGGGDDEKYDPESNPVEWIMVTRSDPGGSVPRFMVERGTPGSIVVDASKFLNWACQNDEVEDSKSDSHVELAYRRDSFASYEANGHLAGLEEDPTKELASGDMRPSVVRPPVRQSASYAQPDSANQSGLLSNMAGVVTAGLETYAPQILLDRLPGHTPQGSVHTGAGSSTTLALEADNDEDDSSDSLSTTSFASADSHFDNEPFPDQPSLALSQTTSKPDKDKPKSKKPGEPHINHHEKELQKLNSRHSALSAKLAAASTLPNPPSQTPKEKDAIRKASEKQAKESAKQQEKLRRELTKIEQRRSKEECKLLDRRAKEERAAEEKKRKEADKDETRKLERERDEAREECRRLRGEREGWMGQVGELQRENTGLVVRVGRLKKELWELRGEGAAGGRKEMEEEKGKEKKKEEQKEKQKLRELQAGDDDDKKYRNSPHPPIPPLPQAHMTEKPATKKNEKKTLPEKDGQPLPSSSSRRARSARAISFGGAATRAGPDITGTGTGTGTSGSGSGNGNANANTNVLRRAATMTADAAAAAAVVGVGTETGGGSAGGGHGVGGGVI